LIDCKKNWQIVQQHLQKLSGTLIALLFFMLIITNFLFLDCCWLQSIKHMKRVALLNFPFI
jgi:hypothetical protein